MVYPEPRKTAKDLTLALKLHKPKVGLFRSQPFVDREGISCVNFTAIERSLTVCAARDDERIITHI